MESFKFLDNHPLQADPLIKHQTFQSKIDFSAFTSVLVQAVKDNITLIVDIGSIHYTFQSYYHLQMVFSWLRQTVA
jgi:hypothetical protein